MKGYYKRAKAHAAVWNEKEARRDFNTVANLDATLASLVSRELRALSERMKEKYWEERETYWNMLEKKENNDGEENKGCQEDSKDEVGGEKCKGSSEGHNEDLLPEGNKEESSSSEINPKSEGKDWQQTLRLIMLLQDEGNFLIKEKRFQDASVKFKEALEYVDTLQAMVSDIVDSVQFG